MNWRFDIDYWDPYKQQREMRKNTQSPKYLHRQTKINSNEKKSPRIVFISTSKQKKSIFQRKSTSKERRLPEEKPFYFNIFNKNHLEEDKNKQDSRVSPSHFNNKNTPDQLVYQRSAHTPRKSPIKIIRKSPSKIVYPPQNAINTVVEAPSSIASSILNNFESHPEKFFTNITDQKLDKIFNF